MNKIINSLPENIYASHLRIINGIKFTKKEIDIMACICQAKSNKGIANFLSEGKIGLTEGAVHSHNNNIKRKTGCYSKEDIAGFVEKTGKHQIISDYYFGLLLHKEFRLLLKELVAKKYFEGVTIVTYKSLEQETGKASEESPPDALLLKYLQDYLSILGAKVAIKSERHFNSISHLNRAYAEKYHVIHVLPSAVQDANDHLYYPEDDESTESYNTTNTILLVPSVIDYPNLLEHDIPFKYIDLKEEHSFFTLFFDILKKLSSPAGNKNSSDIHIELEKIINRFDKKYSNIEGASHKPSAGSHREIDALEVISNKGYTSEKTKSSHKKQRIFYMITFLICSLICISVAWLITSNKISAGTKTFVYSDLAIPESGTLLRRSNITKLIDEKLSNNEGINIVALVGGGGLGKTTLARLYASDKNIPVVWELNAETSHSLMSSFELLAYALCKTTEEKQELNSIQETTSADQKEKLLLLFVQSKLRACDDWLLIYDNIESFEHIRKFFPYDVKAWGKGKALITTRNSNISMNSYIPPKNVITIAELTEPEKFELFCNITGSCITRKGQGRESPQNDGIKAFLTRLPSFPLDISTAAYYIKESGINYTEYLKSIDSQDEKFTSLQESILKDASEYSKTRYEIITLSIKRIIEMNPAYKDLLLSISLIHSQNIPTDLLSTYKDNILVTNFLRELKRVSFITTTASTTSSNKVHTFSIHRSTQAIMLTYLVKALNLNTHANANKDSIVQVADILEKYMSRELVKYYPEEIEMFTSHAEIFLTHKNLLIEEIEADISFQLAKYHFFLGNFERAKKLATIGLEIYSKLFGGNSPKVARSILLLGDICRGMGEYKESQDLVSKGYEIYKSNYGDNNIDSIRARIHLGVVYKHLGLYEKSKEILEATLKPYKNHYGENHIKIANILVNLGAVYKHMGFFKEAIEPLEQGLAIYKSNLGDDHVKVAWTLTILGDVYRSNGMYEKAQSVIEQGSNIYKNHFGENYIKIAWTFVNLSEVYRDLKNYSKAAEILENALVVYKEHYGTNHHKTARVIRDLGEVYLKSGNCAKAEALLNEALAISKAENHPDQFKCLEFLSDLSIEQSRKSITHEQKIKHEAQAKEYLAQSVQVAKELLPQGAPHLKRIESKLAEFHNGQ